MQFDKLNSNFGKFVKNIVDDNKVILDTEKVKEGAVLVVNGTDEKPAVGFSEEPIKTGSEYELRLVTDPDEQPMTPVDVPTVLGLEVIPFKRTMLSSGWQMYHYNNIDDLRVNHDFITGWNGYMLTENRNDGLLEYIDSREPWANQLPTYVQAGVNLHHSAPTAFDSHNLYELRGDEVGVFPTGIWQPDLIPTVFKFLPDNTEIIYDDNVDLSSALRNREHMVLFHTHPTDQPDGPVTLVLYDCAFRVWCSLNKLTARATRTANMRNIFVIEVDGVIYWQLKTSLFHQHANGEVPEGVDDLSNWNKIPLAKDVTRVAHLLDGVIAFTNPEVPTELHVQYYNGDVVKVPETFKGFAYADVNVVAIFESEPGTLKMGWYNRALGLVDMFPTMENVFLLQQIDKGLCIWFSDDVAPGHRMVMLMSDPAGNLTMHDHGELGLELTGTTGYELHQASWGNLGFNDCVCYLSRTGSLELSVTVFDGKNKYAIARSSYGDELDLKDAWERVKSRPESNREVAFANLASKTIFSSLHIPSDDFEIN